MAHRKTSNDSFLEFHPEQLESRQMLAGDVRISTAGDNLTAIGDNFDNTISVLHNADNEIVVQGQDGTTLTYGGVTASSHVLTDLGTDKSVNRLRIVLKGGNDHVSVNGIHAERAVINGGTDDDYIYSANASFGNYKANGNSGLDELRFTGVEMGRARINVEYTVIGFTDFNEELTIRTMNKTEALPSGFHNIISHQSGAICLTRIPRTNSSVLSLV